MDKLPAESLEFVNSAGKLSLWASCDGETGDVTHDEDFSHRYRVRPDGSLLKTSVLLKVVSFTVFRLCSVVQLRSCFGAERICCLTYR